MHLVPTPEATAPPESFARRMLRRAYAQRWRLLWLAGSAAFGLFCRSLPEGMWRDACTALASLADWFAGG